MQTDLYFIRHGETDWNIEGRLQGQCNIPINSNGHLQAHRNGRALKDYFKDKAINPDQLRYISSPLGRTRETMNIVRSELGLEREIYEIEPQIREITFGDWEGLTRAEVAQKEPQAARERAKDKFGYVPPNGESYAMLQQRILEWYTKLNELAVVVSHGGVMRILQGYVMKLPNDDIPILDVPQDKIMLIREGQLIWI